MICNYNPFMTNESIEFVKSVLARNSMTNVLNDTVNFPNNIQRLFIPRYFVGTNARDPNLTSAFKKSLSMSMEQ
jgi:hypothetical protein